MPWQNHRWILREDRNQNEDLKVQLEYNELTVARNMPYVLLTDLCHYVSHNNKQDV